MDTNAGKDANTSCQYCLAEFKTRKSRCEHEHTWCLVKRKMDKDAGKLTKLKCQYCPRLFVNRTSLRCHESNACPVKQQMDKDSGNDLGNKCKYCYREFTNSKGVFVHESRSCTVKKLMDIKAGIMNPNSITPRCDDCGDIFQSTAGLSTHIRSGCNLKRETEKDAAMFLTLKDENKPTLTCQFCSSVLSSKLGLYMHSVFHCSQGKSQLTKNEPTYPCPLCETVLSTEDSIRNHLKSRCSYLNAVNNDKYICKQCGSCFKEKSTLMKHLLVTCRKKFKCRFCDKEYKHENSCRYHERTCPLKTTTLKTGSVKVPVYFCDYCSVEFDSEKGRRYHQLRRCPNMSSDPALPFICHFCRESFADRNKLRSHRRSYCKNRISTNLKIKKRKAQKGKVSSTRLFTCHICGFVKNEAKDVWAHLESEHRQVFPLTMQKPNQDYRDEEVGYLCINCGKCVGDHVLLMAHQDLCLHD